MKKYYKLKYIVMPASGEMLSGGERMTGNEKMFIAVMPASGEMLSEVKE